LLCDFHAHLHEEPDYAETLAETAQNLGFEKLCIGGGEARYGMASNEQVLKHARSYPGLFLPFAWFRLGADSPQRVGEFCRSGFVGLRVGAPPQPYDAEDFFPVYEAACSLGMPVLFHTGFLPPTVLDRALDVRSANMRPVYLDTLARQLPDLKMVGTGLAAPWYEEAAEVLRLHNNVFFDLSGQSLRRKGLDFFRTLLGKPSEPVFEGAEPQGVWSQLVFGTRVRHRDIASVERDYQRLFRVLALSEETSENILGHNAWELLGLSEEGDRPNFCG
jgi:hypothetical protein